MKKIKMKGSITVEASILLPFFVIAIMSFVFVIKIYYTNEIIQNAISGACNDMSLYSLLYYETNAEEIVSGIERFSSSETVRDTVGDNWLTENIEKLGRDATDYLRAQTALVPMTKVLVKNYLETANNNVDERLKGLNFSHGFSDIVFSESRMLADGKSIDIVASYQVEFPFLSNLLPSINIKQEASACIWAGEDGVGANSDESENPANVWDMTNIKRGQEIRKLQGANLPFNFPTIAKFQSGTATSIKSLNIDEEYYKNSENLELKIVGYIKKLEDFSGGKAGNVYISAGEVFRKELVLVIPETQLLPNQQMIIDRCIQTARLKGITLKVVKAYGKQGASKSGTGESEDDQNKND